MIKTLIIFSKYTSIDRFIKHIHICYIPIIMAYDLNLFNTYSMLLKSILLVFFIFLSLTAAGLCDAFFDRKEDITNNMSSWLINPFLTQNIDDNYILKVIIIFYIFTVGYSISLSILFNNYIIIFTIISAILYWIYSDNIYAKKIIGFRLKEHYLLEF
ncbi:MAG: hypothetical protein ACFFDN_43985, partial [Candidatus Hodarchaeota archaeon]